jgi:hypothetical protein
MLLIALSALRILLYFVKTFAVILLHYSHIINKKINYHKPFFSSALFTYTKPFNRKNFGIAIYIGVNLNQVCFLIL